MDGIDKPVIRMAFAYIVKNNQLLVFEHDGIPSAGTQVPAGSIESDETPQEGALREAQEETGLTQLAIVQFLGEQVRDMSDYGKDEIHHRYFYQLACLEDMPESWQHGERFPSGVKHASDSFAHNFNCYWVDLNAVPELIADMGHYINQLNVILRTNQKKANER